MILFQASWRSPALFLLACAVLLAPVARGLSQETPVQKEPGAAELEALRSRASTLLSSDDKRDQAWGAFYVAQHRLADLSPIAERVLAKRVAQNAAGEDRLLVSALIDALIQNEGKPRPGLLSALWEKGYRNEVMAMAAAHTEHVAPDLVSLLKVEMSEVQHAAVCNLLTQYTPRLFVEAVLPRIQQLTLLLDITDPARELEGGGDFGSFSTRCRDGTVRRDVGLPPRVLYTLSFCPRNGYVVLACGPRTVYVERRVYWKEGGCGSVSSPMKDAAAQEYWRDCLVRLAFGDLSPDRKERLGLRWNNQIEVPWKNLAALRKSAIEARADMRAPWLDLCRGLQGNKLLPADTELGKLFPVRIELRDSRNEMQKRDVPLPNVDDLLNEDVPLPKEDELRKQSVGGKDAF